MFCLQYFSEQSLVKYEWDFSAQCDINIDFVRGIYVVTNAIWKRKVYVKPPKMCTCSGHFCLCDYGGLQTIVVLCDCFVFIPHQTGVHNNEYYLVLSPKHCFLWSMSCTVAGHKLNLPVRFSHAGFRHFNFKNKKCSLK